MMRLRRVFLKFAIPVGVAVVMVGQAVSWTYQRYLRCQGTAEDLLGSEAMYRQKAGVCEEMAPRFREVAELARELAKSATSDFERKKWLDMAHADEVKAANASREALRMMRWADHSASRAAKFSRLAWRPWIEEP